MRLKFIEGQLVGTFAPPPGDAGGGGGGGEVSFPTDKPFSDYVPAQYRSEPSLRDIKSFDGLISSYVNGQKMLGDKSKLLTIPADNDADGWNKFFNAQGRPEKAEAYKIPGRADGKAYSEAELAFQKQIVPLLHETGLTQRQIDRLIPKWNQTMDGINKANGDAAKAELDAAAGKLKTELGANFEDHLGLADGALRHYADQLKLGDEILAELDRTKLGNSPALFKLFAHLGSQLKEDGLLGKETGAGGAGLSPDDAKKQINEKNQNEEIRKIRLDKKHPKHGEVEAEMAALYAAAYPQSSAAA